MGSGRLGSVFTDEEDVLLVPRRIERTLYSLLGGVGVTATVGLKASTTQSSLLTCCCLTSRSDCSGETERERERERERMRSVEVHQIKISSSWFPQRQIIK